MNRHLSVASRKSGWSVFLRGCLLLSLGLLAACGSVPQPFQHERTSGVANPLVTLRAGPGVTVRPTLGLDVPWNRLVALELAEMLRGNEIPAEAQLGGPPLGYELISEARMGPPDEFRRVITLAWRLRAANGDLVDTGRADVTVPTLSWERAAPEAAQALGRPALAAVMQAVGPQQATRRDRTSTPVAPVGPSDTVPPDLSRPPAAGPALSGGPEPEAPIIASVAAPDQAPSSSAGEPSATPAGVVAPPEELRVFVSVLRAPGDGVQALTDILSTRLRQAQIPVSPTRDEATVILSGTVDATPQADGQDDIVIVWTVSDASDAVLGTIRQQNQVPAGSLNGAWGPVAGLVAQGALIGLGQTLLGEGAGP